MANRKGKAVKGDDLQRNKKKNVPGRELVKTLEKDVTAEAKMEEKEKHLLPEIKKFASAHFSLFIYAGLIIIIMIILVGLFSVFTSMPSMILGKLQLFDEGTKEQIANFFNQKAFKKIEADEMTKVANKLQVMGYDIEAYGFGLVSEYEEGQYDNNGAYTIEKGKSLQIKSLYTGAESNLTAYMAADLSAYVKGENNFTNFFPNDENPYTTGLLDIQSTEAKFEIDTNSYRLKSFEYSLFFPKWTTTFSFDLHDWNGTYGRPLELFLALHTGTMMPDLTNHIATDNVFATKVHILTQKITVNFDVTADVQPLAGKTVSSQTLRSVESSKSGYAETQTLYYPYINYVSNHWYYKTIDFMGGTANPEYGAYRKNGTLKSIGLDTSNLVKTETFSDAVAYYNLTVASYTPKNKIIHQVTEPYLNADTPNDYITALFNGGKGKTNKDYENGEEYSYSGKYYRYDGSLDTARKITIAKTLDAIVDEQVAKNKKNKQYLLNDAYIEFPDEIVTTSEARRVLQGKITYKWRDTPTSYKITDLVISKDEIEEYVNAKVAEGSFKPETVKEKRALNQNKYADDPMTKKEVAFKTVEDEKKNGVGVETRQSALNTFVILENANTLQSEQVLRALKNLMVKLNYFKETDISSDEKNTILWPVDNEVPGDSTRWRVTTGDIKYEQNKNGETSRDPDKYAIYIDNVDPVSTIVAPGDGRVVSLESLKQNNDSVVFNKGIEEFDDSDTVVIQLDKLSNETIEILQFRFKEEYADIYESIVPNNTTSVYIIISNIVINSSVVKDGANIKRGAVIGYPKKVEPSEENPNGTDRVIVKMIKQSGELVEDIEEYLKPTYTKTDEAMWKREKENYKKGSKYGVSLFRPKNDYIVKTDMAGAAPFVTDRDEFEAGLKKWLKKDPDSAWRTDNALKILDYMLENQEKYKVNTVFVYAVFKYEQQLGTARDSDIPREYNNWGSVKATKTTWKKFATLKDMVDFEYKLFAEKEDFYFSVQHYSVKTIGPDYCPPGDSWSKSIINIMNKLYKALGIDPSSTTGTGTEMKSDEEYEEPEDQNTGDGYTSRHEVKLEEGSIYYKNYKQFKGSYKDNKYANGKIKSAGAGPVAVAIAISAYGTEASPAEVAKAMGGANNGGTTMSKIDNAINKYGLSAKGVSFGNNQVAIKQILLEQLRQKKPVVLCVGASSIGLTTSSHIVALLEIDEYNNKVYVSNPNEKDDSKLHGWMNFDQICEAALNKYTVLVQATPQASNNFESIHLTDASTWFRWNGRDYCVPKAANGYTNLMSYAAGLIGPQLPEQCLQYAMKYASAMLSLSVAKSKGDCAGSRKCATPVKQNLLYVAAKELMEGRPSVIRVRGGREFTGDDGVLRWTRHYVTVVGVYKNANLYNLKEDDFLLLDPGGASYAQLGKGRRWLLPKELDAWHYYKAKGLPGYQIYLYTDHNKYSKYVVRDDGTRGTYPDGYFNSTQ